MKDANGNELCRHCGEPITLVAVHPNTYIHVKKHRPEPYVEPTQTDNDIAQIKSDVEAGGYSKYGLTAAMRLLLVLCDKVLAQKGASR